MAEIRVLLAEDHTIVRKGLRALLDEVPGIQVVGEAGDGREAVEKAERLLPDVVLMDISMPGLNGLEATRAIGKLRPRIKVLVLTMHADEEHIYQMLRAGASGYLLKHTAPGESVAAIRAISQGDSFLSPAIPWRAVEEYARQANVTTIKDSYDLLTRREREVLQLIAEGHPNREIAALLHISVKTVETHRSHLMDKLNIYNTAGLTRYALRRGIIGSFPE